MSFSGKAVRLLVPAALLGMGAGCTFLISFDDVPAADAGVGPASTAPSIKDSGAPSSQDAGAQDSGTVVPGAAEVCDETFPTNTVKGCDKYVDNGQICADTATNLSFAPGYDASADVVTCSRAGTPHASCVKRCLGPGKCAHNPNGFPDQCDQCAGKADGTHCGSEMAGWPPETFKLLITCGSDRISKTTIACATTCNPKGGTGQAACN